MGQTDSSEYGQARSPRWKASPRSSTTSAKQGTLHFQRCTSCKAWRHVPREMCAECGSWEWAWDAVELGGAGSSPGQSSRVRCTRRFKRTPPTQPVIVEMDEGVRLL